MSGSDPDLMADKIRRLREQTHGPGSDAGDLGAADPGLAFDSKVMRQAIKLHRRELAGLGSDKGFLDSYFEAAEIDLHESWF